MIRISHKIFAGNSDYQYTFYNPYYNHFHKNEIYLDIVPLFFSVLMFPLVYLFCLYFINQKTGLLACFLLCVSPTDILCADRIWSDSILSFFMFGSALLFLLSNNKSNFWLAIISGILSGLAVLTKVSGLFVPLILGFYSLIIISLRSYKHKKLLINPEAKHYFILCAITLLMTLPWFMLVVRTFGDPLHFPYQANSEQIRSWFYIVRHRPWYTYPADILYQNPIWIFSLIGAKYVPRGNNIRFFLVVWITILITYLTFVMLGKENRYMLPTYPAIAILTAIGFIHATEEINKKSIKWLNYLPILALAASLIFSTYTALNIVDIIKGDESFKPF